MSTYSVQARHTSHLSRTRMRRCLYIDIGLVCCALLGMLLLASCNNKAVMENVEYREGSAALTYDARNTKNPNSYLDLDTGSVIDNTDADIALIVSGGTSLFSVLQPINGAKGSLLTGTENISLDNCGQHLETLVTNNIPDFSPGRYICVLTNQGRLALVEIGKVTSSENSTISVHLKFMTEYSPQPK